MENERETSALDLVQGPQAFEEGLQGEEVQVTLAWLPLQQNHTQEKRSAGLREERLD